ncbi:MAG TPA: Pycsar system effector family protein [Longimicrobium sp.]|jgi:hypothetical protein
MEEGPNLDVLEKTLERMLLWIAAADNKVAPVMAIDTAMLGVVAAIAPKPGNWTLGAGLTTAVTVALIFASLIILFFAAFPQTSGPKGSLVFFGGITQRDLDVFVTEITDLPIGNYRKDLAHQCYRNAEIAGRKYRYVKFAMATLFAAIIPWMLAVYLMYGAGSDRYLA